MDFLAGSIWKNAYDPVKKQDCTGIAVIDNDEKITRLADEIQTLYSSYYEFDSHNMPCWFNKAKEKADKEKMLALLRGLRQRLDVLRDGSFLIRDEETARVKAL